MLQAFSACRASAQFGQKRTLNQGSKRSKYPIADCKKMPENPYAQPIGKKRSQLKAQISKSRAIANSIWDKESTSGAQKMALGMWLKTIESCEATDVLGSRGMLGAAWANIRVGYECLFYMCAILKDSANAERLADHHFFQVAKLLKDQIRDKSSDGSLTFEQKSEIAHYDQFMKQHPNWSAADAAKDAGMFDQYSEFFRTISQLGAHANISSLDQHLDETRNRLMIRGVRVQDRDSQINLAVMCLALGLDRLNTAFP